jgi:hypothetical protein
MRDPISPAQLRPEFDTRGASADHFRPDESQHFLEEKIVWGCVPIKRDGAISEKQEITQSRILRNFG